MKKSVTQLIIVDEENMFAEHKSKTPAFAYEFNLFSMSHSESPNDLRFINLSQLSCTSRLNCFCFWTPTKSGSALLFNGRQSVTSESPESTRMGENRNRRNFWPTLRTRFATELKCAVTARTQTFSLKVLLMINKPFDQSIRTIAGYQFSKPLLPKRYNLRNCSKRFDLFSKRW